MEEKKIDSTESNEQIQQVQKQENSGVPIRKRRKKKSVVRSVTRFIVWVIIITAAVFLTLFLSARISGFDSIIEMIRFILN